MTQEKIIACKDCIHYHRDREYGHTVCFRPYRTTVDYCTGEYVQNSAYRSITEERSYFVVILLNSLNQNLPSKKKLFNSSRKEIHDHHSFNFGYNLHWMV
jgi:hypothetical protein